MTIFSENKTLTLEGNLEKLMGIAKIGDRFTSGSLVYQRVDIRKNKGTAWVLIPHVNNEGPCTHEYDNGTGHVQCSLEHDNCVGYIACKCYKKRSE